MEKKKGTMEISKIDLERVEEINQHISDALQQWASIMIMSDKDGWDFALEYSVEDVLNAVSIFGHVLGRYGSEKGIITAKNYHALCDQMMALVKGMTGVRLNRMGEVGGAGEGS